MPHDESKRAQAIELRAQGVHVRVVAEQVGVGIGTVYRWTNPESLERSRAASTAWKARNPERVRELAHKPCPRCGRTCARQSNRCARCHTQDVEERWLALEAFARAGATLDQIVTVVGFANRKHAQAELARRRAEGRPIPHLRDARKAAAS